MNMKNHITLNCYVDELLGTTDGKFDHLEQAWFTVPTEWAEQRIKPLWCYTSIQQFQDEYTLDHTIDWFPDAVRDGVLLGCGTGCPPEYMANQSFENHKLPSKIEADHTGFIVVYEVSEDVEDSTVHTLEVPSDIDSESDVLRWFRQTYTDISPSRILTVGRKIKLPPVTIGQRELIEKLSDVLSDLSEESLNNDEFNEYLSELDLFKRCLNESARFLQDELSTMI
ncbi:hypothetical protein [Brevibacillus reuszeri]|uniref:hypothetical protein n=1 Tax=Brevibacillus reuszeri TaxID=54915 RepID=UPI000CCBE367|nr:hypothetical protein [Brevibacillus reuszeri]